MVNPDGPEKKFWLYSGLGVTGSTLGWGWRCVVCPRGIDAPAFLSVTVWLSVVCHSGAAWCGGRPASGRDCVMFS